MTSISAAGIGAPATPSTRVAAEAATDSGAPSWLKPVAIGVGGLAALGGIALALRGSGHMRLVGGAVAALAGALTLSGCSTSQSAAQGSTPDAVVDSILRQYDHTRDGVISLDSPSGLPKDDERIRVQVRQRKETETDWDPNDEDFLPYGNPWGDSTTTRWSERRLISGHRMFTAANEDGDRTVTRAELLDLVKQYDDFADGKIGSKELDAFRKDNPEEFDAWTRIGR